MLNAPVWIVVGGTAVFGALNPSALYSEPNALAEQVYVDGAVVFDRHDPTRQPLSDFELGQAGPAHPGARP